MKDAKTVLITGVTGQDGSYMVEYLLKYTSLNIVGLSKERIKDYGDYISECLSSPRFKSIKVNLLDHPSITKTIKKYKPDYFINFAGQSSVGKSWKMPAETMAVNANGVQICLEAIRKYSRKCRFFNAGSSEAFGVSIYTPKDEQHPLASKSPYAESKIAAGYIVKEYREKHNLFAIQALLFNHESERRGPQFVTRKITDTVAKIKLSIESGVDFEPLELGNINMRRDWSHAEDFVVAIWAMLNEDDPNDYVLASGELNSVRDFVENAFNLAGVPNTWTFCGDPQEPESEVLVNDSGDILMRVNSEFYRPAEPDVSVGNIDKIYSRLGWFPTIKFSKLVKRMLDAGPKTL
jgi:GDPmannose 4,6-dehydratase